MLMDNHFHRAPTSARSLGGGQDLALQNVARHAMLNLGMRSSLRSRRLPRATPAPAAMPRSFTIRRSQGIGPGAWDWPLGSQDLALGVFWLKSPSPPPTRKNCPLGAHTSLARERRQCVVSQEVATLSRSRGRETHSVANRAQSVSRRFTGLLLLAEKGRPRGAYPEKWRTWRPHKHGHRLSTRSSVPAATAFGVPVPAGSAR